MKVSWKKISCLLLGFGVLGLSACENRNPQVSGIVAIANFETVACVPQEKTFKIRNNDASEPQRIQGVHFELGTNNDKYYKVVEVAANNKVKKAVGDLVEEIQLAPGAVMSVKVAYNPKATTSGEQRHRTYLDVVLNGPKLGVMQIELAGKAETALEGCSADAGGQEFEVLGVKTTLSHQDLPANVVSDLNVSTDVAGSFRFNIDGEKVAIATSGWPTITFPLPEGSPITEMEIKLAEDSPEGSFVEGKLTIEGLSVSGSNVVNLAGLTLTTESITIGTDKAPKVKDGSITFTGSPLDETSGEMTLVIAAPLTVPPVDTVAQVGGGVFGMEIKLKKK